MQDSSNLKSPRIRMPSLVHAVAFARPFPLNSSMLDTLLKKFIGSTTDRELKKIQPLVQKINDLEPQVSSLTDEQLRSKTAEFKQRFENGESLQDLLPETFAVVREAGKRVLNMRHFDVQLIGGVVLHQGRIAEMKTGEEIGRAS